MEGSESEAVFDSFDLNPQRFINEVLNSVDDLVDGALAYYHQEAVKVVGANCLCIIKMMQIASQLTGKLEKLITTSKEQKGEARHERIHNSSVESSILTCNKFWDFRGQI